MITLLGVWGRRPVASTCPVRRPCSGAKLAFAVANEALGFLVRGYELEPEKNKKNSYYKFKHSEEHCLQPACRPGPARGNDVNRSVGGRGCVQLHARAIPRL